MSKKQQGKGIVLNCSSLLHTIPSGPVVERRSAAVQAARDVGEPVHTS